MQDFITVHEQLYAVFASSMCFLSLLTKSFCRYKILHLKEGMKDLWTKKATNEEIDQFLQSIVNSNVRKFVVLYCLTMYTFAMFFINILMVVQYLELSLHKSLSTKGMA